MVFTINFVGKGGFFERQAFPTLRGLSLSAATWARRRPRRPSLAEQPVFSLSSSRSLSLSCVACPYLERRLTAARRAMRRLPLRIEEERLLRTFAETNSGVCPQFRGQCGDCPSVSLLGAVPTGARGLSLLGAVSLEVVRSSPVKPAMGWALGGPVSGVPGVLGCDADGDVGGPGVRGRK